jgi:hypothetical protein
LGGVFRVIARHPGMTSRSQILSSKPEPGKMDAFVTLQAGLR